MSGPVVATLSVNVALPGIAAAADAHLLPEGLGHWPRGVACVCYVLVMVAAARWAEADYERSRVAEDITKARVRGGGEQADAEHG